MAMNAGLLGRASLDLQRLHRDGRRRRRRGLHDGVRGGFCSVNRGLGFGHHLQVGLAFHGRSPLWPLFVKVGDGLNKLFAVAPIHETAHFLIVMGFRVSASFAPADRWILWCHNPLAPRSLPVPVLLDLDPDGPECFLPAVLAKMVILLVVHGVIES
jgi:hypothetical protein